jgi:hypothetical protein
MAWRSGRRQCGSALGDRGNSRPSKHACTRSGSEGARTDDEYRRPLWFADSSSASLIGRRRTRGSAETVSAGWQHAPLRDARLFSTPTARLWGSLPASNGIPSLAAHRLCARNVRTNCPGAQKMAESKPGLPRQGPTPYPGGSARIDRRQVSQADTDARAPLEWDCHPQRPKPGALIPPPARKLPLDAAFP